MSPATQTFFRSRWVTPPPEFEQLDPAELAPGFQAAGVACGLKGGGETDVGVLACGADEVSSALALTRNAAAAALCLAVTGIERPSRCGMRPPRPSASNRGAWR